MKSRSLSSNRRINIYPFLIYLLSPLVSIILALRNLRAPWAKDVVWLFTIFYGFTLYIASGSGADAVRYKDTLIEMAKSDLSLQSLGDLFYSEEGGYIDIAQPLITFFVSRFTDNYKFLFAVFGFFYGYLYSRNLWYLIDRAGDRISRWAGILLIIFAFIVGIASMNGLRFWTATHLFFFGLMPYIVEGRKKSLWISACSVFVHFSFVLPLVVLLIYMFFGNKLKFYFLLFVISFFISELNMELLTNATSIFPAIVQKKARSYMNEDYIENVQEVKASRSWFIGVSSKAVAYTIVVLALVIFLRREKYLEDEQLLHLFCVGLLFYGVFNILNAVPSVGRFLSLSKMLLISCCFWIYNRYPDVVLKRIIILAVPGLSLFLLLQLRIMAGYSSYLLFLGNPISAIFLPPDAGVLDLF